MLVPLILFCTVRARKYCLEYYLHFVYFTIATRAGIPCTAWSLIALSCDYLFIDPFTCTKPHPRFTTPLSYTLLKYIGVRLYSAVINVKWKSKLDNTYIHGSIVHVPYPPYQDTFIQG